jgi:mono/diheme cytochrome c family protein
LRRFLIGALVSAAGLVPALAQTPATVLDGVYTPEQAARGESVYARSCRGCHEAQDADGPLLSGKVFLDRWREDTLEPLYTFIKSNMPGNNPGSLDGAAYVDVVAFVLEANGLPSGTKELTADMLGRIELVGAEGPRPLSNLTIVRTVGCLNPGADDAWTLTRAANLHPVRARVVTAATPQELEVSAVQPLGSRTFPLMSVTSQVASLARNKVQVTGVLTRQGTLERINVMSLDSVAPMCGG